MTPDPIVCRHCQLERHTDCAERACECACRRPAAPPVRKGGRLRRLLNGLPVPPTG